MHEAQRDLARFDRVLGSAEAISGAVSGSGRVARTALSTPVIKVAAIASGTSRAAKRLSRRRRRDERRDAGRRRAASNVVPWKKGA
jgi:protein involved in polysaccharide export with SLBB domain